MKDAESQPLLPEKEQQQAPEKIVAEAFVPPPSSPVEEESPFHENEMKKACRRGSVMFAARWAQQGVYLSYLGLYLQSLSYSFMEIGILYTLLMLAMSVGSYALPVIVDSTFLHSYSHTHIALAAHAVGTVCLFLLILLPSGASIYPAGALVFVGNFCNGGFGPLVDSAVFHVIAAYPSSSSHSGADFGSMRLWGCVSWGLSVMLTSFLLDHVWTSFGLRPMWLVYLFLAPLTHFASKDLLIAEYGYEPPKPKKATDESHSTSVLNWASMPAVFTFLIQIALLGLMFSSLNTYVYLWAVGTLHASYTTIGVATVTLNVCEVLIFLFSKQCAAWLGVHGVFLLSASSYGIRLFCYGYLADASWWLVAMEPLHALNFSLPMGVMGTYTTKTADHVGAGRVSTQGFRTATMNVGRTVGFLLSAYLYQSHSAEYMFRCMLWSAVPLMISACIGMEYFAKRDGLGKLLFSGG